MTFAKKTILRSISNILLTTGLVILILDFTPIVLQELSYKLRVFRNVNYSVKAGDLPQGKRASDLFGALVDGSKTLDIVPTNTDFSVIIEKIGVNAPIVKNVSVTEKDEYFEALKLGVAHANSASTPDKGGNTYLFAHSSNNFWSIGKYATIFNLLRKVENGDKVNVFYDGVRYEYEVIGNEVVSGFNTNPLTREVLEPILTLQTCDPPGTTLNRLVVTAKLIEVYKD